MSNRNQSIDALRAIAALAILIHHNWIPQGVGFRPYDVFLNFFHEYGFFGIDLFFILSGFCIHWGNSKPGLEFNTQHYVLRRWWRIYPPYFFALGLAVIINIFTNGFKWHSGGDISWRNFGAMPVLSHVFLVHNLSSVTNGSISGPFWTIAVEAQYYLIYLLVRPLFFSKRGWGVVLIAGLLMHGAALCFQNTFYPFQPLAPFRYWMEWLAGAYLVYLIRGNSSIVQRWPYWLGLFVTFFITGIITCPRWKNLGEGLVSYAIPIALVFLVLAFLRLERIWSLPLLRWLPFIGLFSYSLYLIHFLFMERICAFIMPRVPLGLPRVTFSLADIAFGIAISYAFFVYFEKPFLEKSSAIKPINRQKIDLAALETAPIK